MCGACPGWCFFYVVSVYFDVDRHGHRDDGGAGGAAGDVYDHGVADFHDAIVHYSVDDHDLDHCGDDDHHDPHQPGRAGEPDAGWLSLGFR